MDTLNIVTNALIIGASTVGRSTVDQAVKDTYKNLKRIIYDRYDQIAFYLERIEQQPRSGEEAIMLRISIAKSQAHKDETVIAFASELWADAGKPAIQPSITDYEYLLELAEYEAGQEAVDTILEEHLVEILDIRSNYQITNLDLLSSNISRHKQIPKDIKSEISNLRLKLRAVIEAVATNIEERKYKSSEVAIENFDGYNREQASRIVYADKKVHISCQSLKIAIDYFSRCNKAILNRIKDVEVKNDAASETKLVLGNAILVYELTNFVIEFIEDFELTGLPEIIELYNEALNNVKDMRKKENALRRKANAEQTEITFKQQLLTDIKTREEAIDVIEHEWSNYVESVKSLDRDTGSVQSKLPTLKLIRENAYNQINVLAAIALLQILQNNLSELQATILTLENIELAPLSADRVRRLLGV